MAAILLDVQVGDEVIVPSYTFVSTANAFALRGATIVFAEVDADTLNINIDMLEDLITVKTKAIVPVHYAGVSCDMNSLMALADKYNIKVVEDAAQCIGSRRQDRFVGTCGHIATFSFHETKNVTAAGEGGLLIINDDAFLKRAEILREKGTNRHSFSNGLVDKYTWVDIGSSYLLGELNAAYLYSQLLNLEKITHARLVCWRKYFKLLRHLECQGFIQLPSIPQECEHNGHIFHVRLKDSESRANLIDYLKKEGVLSVFHYVPLHNSPMGEKIGCSSTNMQVTVNESQRLLRLPMYFGLEIKEIVLITDHIYDFFDGKSQVLAA